MKAHRRTTQMAGRQRYPSRATREREITSEMLYLGGDSGGVRKIDKTAVGDHGFRCAGSAAIRNDSAGGINTESTEMRGLDAGTGQSGSSIRRSITRVNQIETAVVASKVA